MKIPKRFKQYGQTIRVAYNAKILNRDEVVGLCDIKQCLIELCPSTEAAPISEGKIEQTFVHEWVHIILDSMGERELSRNEKFVQQFAGLLHQGMTTAEYK